MPPKVTREQAVHFMESLVRGEPDRLAIFAENIGGRIREMV
jgi:hypothetical protein